MIQDQKDLKSTELEKLRAVIQKYNKALASSLSKVENIKEDIDNDKHLLSIHMANLCVYKDNPTTTYLHSKLEHLSKQVSLELAYIKTKLEIKEK